MLIIRRTGENKRKGPLIIHDPIEPVPYQVKETKELVATWDTETDPFLPGRIVKPFTCGFHIPDLNFYIDFWGRDCVDQFFAWLDKATGSSGEFEGITFLIFCHNFGNFDAYFMLDHFDKGHSPFIINGRLVRVEAHGHIFRDSYAMIPVALGTYDKDAIDYRCMEDGFREVYRDKILSYMKRDCTALGELVTAWLDMFGNRLTMASVALPMLRSYHGFETLSDKLDNDLRPFYFGGRNQCFSVGIHHGNFKVFDINSSYPDVMRRFNHPIGDTPRYSARITEKTHFAYIRAWSLGALPVRKDDGGLDFPIGTRDFYACIHEIRAGLETKTLKIRKVHYAIHFDAETNFAEFIDDFYAKRMEASDNKDEILKLFYKLVMNSSYGKFAQDPRRYENWAFDPEEIPEPAYCKECHKRILKREPKEACNLCDGEQPTHSPYGWYLHSQKDGRNIYASPQRAKPGSFFNVATAASITSAARASLLYGIQSATRPLYCDTDSLICEGFDAREDWGIRIDDKALGAWKSEAEGDTVCIAGKKLYAVFNNGECIKKASKGVRLSPEQIKRVCDGETIEYANPVPKFNLDGETAFVTRKIRKTG